MILEPELINRYLRQIILPEVSGPGQKLLLESTVAVHSETVAAIAPALYYLTASGIGSIYCQFKDAAGFSALAAQLVDLHPSVNLPNVIPGNPDLRVLIGEPDFIRQQLEDLTANFVPVIIGLYYGWQGGIAVCHNQDELRQLAAALAFTGETFRVRQGSRASLGALLATGFLGPLTVLEGIKCLLNLGERQEGLLGFNLQTMDFTRKNFSLSQAFLGDLLAPSAVVEPIATLSSKKALIVGTGGLGSPAAYTLALAGIGTLGLVDYDTVEISNLNRQILHSTSRLGMPKAHSAAIALKRLNPLLTVCEYPLALTEENAGELIAGYDLVIDAVDNFPTRFGLNDACFLGGKPLIEAGVIRFDGSCMTIIPHQTPCYRCLLPAPPPQGSVPACAESGVLGPVPGIIGALQAVEAVKYLTASGNGLTGKMLFLDGLAGEFLMLELHSRQNCPICGTRQG